MCDLISGYVRSLAGDEDVNNQLSGLSIKESMDKGSKSGTNGKAPVTRGQVTRFGFKRPTPPSPQLPSVPPSPADVNVQETIEPLVIAPVLPKNGTPRLSRARKEGKAPNRFGFIPPANQLSNKVADLQGSQENLRPPTAIKLGGVRSQSETRYKSVDGKVITSSSKLPQHSLQRPSPYHHRSNDSVVCSPAAGKMAKTAANNHTLRASNNGSLADGAASRLKRNEEVMEIRQLEQSPGAASKFRHQPAQQKLARPMEMVFSTPKRFELRDLPPSGGSRCQETPTRGSESDPGMVGLNGLGLNIGLGLNTGLNNGMVSPAHNMSVNERIRREVVGLPPRYPSSMTSSVMSSSSVLSPDTGDEEKLARDTRTTEKTSTVVDDDVPSEEDLWGGPGEAMAIEDGMPNTNLADLDHSPETMNPPLRSVLLTIEDPTFATLAALSNAGLLEDETAPDSPDISDSSPSSVEPLPPPPPHISSKPGSPHSPGTPTHASNSSSSDTKDRDFLIDDEIADQPGLVFGSGRRRDDEQNIILDRARTLAHIAGDVSQALHNSLHRDSHGGSAGSISTLSPCESLASDDLMGDYDISALDDLNDIDDAHIKSEIMNQSDQVIREWSSLLSSHPGLSSGLRKTPRPRLRSATRAGASAQGDASPLAHNSPRRQPRRIETRSPGDDKSDDSGIKLRKDTWQHMYQDVINIKGVLNELKRALGQPEPSTAEEDVVNKGPGGTHDHHFPGEDGLHLDDLRRQIMLLEMENEEKDLKIKRLEEQLKAAFEARPAPPLRSPDLPKLANISTQTDRVRPVTTLFHNSPNNATASIVRLSASSESEKAGLRYHRRPQLSAPLNSYKVS